MLYSDYQTLDPMVVNDVGYDYTMAHQNREFRVLAAISDAATASHWQLTSGQEVRFSTTLSMKQCSEVVSRLGLVPESISVTKWLGIFKKEVTVKF